MLVAMGGKGIIYWCYLTEATGTESTGFGLVERDGSASERVLEAAQDHKLIQTQWEIIKDYKPGPEVAVVVDIDNALLTFAMSGKEDASTMSFAGYYKALWNSDVLVDFIEPQSLSNSGKYKVIIAPWHLIGKKDTCDHLRQFVEDGGTLLLETGFASYDEHMVYNPIVPAFGLADAFGYREKESLYMMQEDGKDNPKAEDVPQSDRVYVEGHLSFTEPVAVQIKAHTFLTPITVSSAKVIATYESTPVAATKKVGKGLVYYVGTNLGASIEAGSQAGIDLVKAIVNQAARSTVVSEKVRPRLIEAESGTLLIVFNDQITDQAAGIRVPSRRYKIATNIYDNQVQTIQNGTVEVQVPFEGVTVLRLS